ncbi:MAG: saccharopine dehydrogenase NADP-binding domain-containing protein [Planctomycetes bacterium]|nr:saccharopine dehydrogenase NADP-binding domain-containing protein [Planctomycetota bacterium]
MSTKAVVLGCGLVGATMARDLAADSAFEVAVVDVSAERLAQAAAGARLHTRQEDLADMRRLAALVADFDLVLGALPSAIGFSALRTIIEAGKPYCDITFMPEDAWELDDLARRRGVLAVVDCGVSPGLSNLAIGHAHSLLDRTERAEILVGGLPKVRRWPFQYKAPFAPSDVVEEYTRPARIKEHGQVVVRPALSEPELVDLPRVGTLEAFNTDGLRSLLATLDIPNMKEKTLRYPGHAELMRVFRETGFFEKQEIEVRGAKVRPLDVTARLLFPKWTHEPGEEEFTVMRVTVAGEAGGRSYCHVYDLYDETDRASGVSSMARTTGFPCAIVARLIARGELREPGVLPPERLARHAGVFDHMVRELAARGVHLTHCVSGIAADPPSA